MLSNSATGQSAWQNIPSEIKIAILNCLPRADLFAARLVNKHFASIAAPRLFRTISLWISMKSLESLTCLSKHPTLRGHIKELIFSPLWLEDNPGYLKGAQSDFLISEDVISVAFRYGKHLSAYHAYMGAQCYLVEDGLATKLLTRALRELHALKTITLSLQDEQIGCRELIGAFGTFNYDELLDFDGERTLPIFVGALAASGVKITEFTIVWDPIASRMRYEQPPIDDNEEEEELRKFEEAIILTAGSLAKVCSYFENKLQVFQALHNFTFAPRGWVSGNYDEESAYAKSVRNIIASAELLEVLKVEESATWHDFPDSHRTSISAFLEPRGLKRLRSLHICNVDATLQQLTEFFQQRPTLTEVKLRSVRCRDAKWSVVLDHLRSYSYPRLQCFTLYWHTDWTTTPVLKTRSFEVEVSDYLLHKTERNPGEAVPDST